jgi:hypothetical protein
MVQTVDFLLPQQEHSLTTASTSRSAESQSIPPRPEVSVRRQAIFDAAPCCFQDLEN